jgi:prepilin-type N-terminal cleavage/methylation domain-containing protein
MKRPGVTLLELLVVITIIVMIAAAAIPIMLSGTESRRTREATRQVHAFFAGARTRAAENGRSFGVRIERFNNGPFSMNLSYVEVPPAYCGDYENSKARVHAGQLTDLGVHIHPATMTNWPNSQINDSWPLMQLRPGDSIKLNYRGPVYRIGGATDANGFLAALPWTLLSTSGTPPFDTIDFNPPFDAKKPAPENGVPYQIVRQPVKSAAVPLQLPEGAVIDLLNSGVGSNAFAANDVAPVMLTFSPTGATEYVYFQGQPGQRLTGAVHFLIGRSEAVGAENLADQNNCWVSVGSQTGKITAAENMGGSLQNARKFSVSAQDLGGR